MVPVAVLLALVGALFSSPLVRTAQDTAQEAVFDAAPTHALGGWMDATGRQLRESESRADFLERLDAAIAGLDVAALTRALRTVLQEKDLDTELTMPGREPPSTGMLSRAERLLGPRYAARFADGWAALWPSIHAQVAAERKDHAATATLADMLERAEHEMTLAIHGLGDNRRDHLARVGDLVGFRWVLANLALAAPNDLPLPDFIAETYLDLFETVVTLARYDPDPNAFAPLEPLVPWRPSVPSLAWLLTHARFEDPHCGPLLRKTPGLQTLVVETRLRLTAYFPDDTTYSLRTPVDPDSGSEYLFLAIRSPGSLRAAAERLDRFSADWALEAHTGWGGRFLVDVEPA